jgi:hypothetical protein
MSIRLPQRLLEPGIPWFDPKTGQPTLEFYAYMREMDAVMRRLLGIYTPVTVANLPAATAGDVAFASNGRKAGEGAGSGTGVLVFYDGTAWRAVDTGATVAA